MVVRDEAYVGGVDYAEGGGAVAEYGKEGDEHVVDYVDYVVVAATDIDPVWWVGCVSMVWDRERGERTD